MFSQKLSQLPVCGVEVRVVKAPALGASSRLLLIASEIVRAVPAIERALGDRASQVADAVSDVVRIAAVVTWSTSE